MPVGTMMLHKGALGAPGLLKSSGNKGPGDAGMARLSMAALESQEGPTLEKLPVETAAPGPLAHPPLCAQCGV